MKITSDTNLRSFQYKYLMHIVPNNEKLFIYGMTESSLCDFCSTRLESNIHLFWEFPFVQPFWTQLKNFLIEKLNTPSKTLLTHQSISLCSGY